MRRSLVRQSCTLVLVLPSVSSPFCPGPRAGRCARGAGRGVPHGIRRRARPRPPIDNLVRDKKVKRSSRSRRVPQLRTRNTGRVDRRNTKQAASNAAASRAKRPGPKVTRAARAGGFTQATKRALRGEAAPPGAPEHRSHGCLKGRRVGVRFEGPRRGGAVLVKHFLLLAACAARSRAHPYRQPLQFVMVYNC